MAYLKKQKLADVTFNVFALCWVVSRIGLLPYRIIYFSSYVALAIVPMFSAYYIFNGLLIALQTLHIIWTFFIIKMAILAWNNNGVSVSLLPVCSICTHLHPFSMPNYHRSRTFARMMKTTSGCPQAAEAAVAAVAQSAAQRFSVLSTTKRRWEQVERS